MTFNAREREKKFPLIERSRLAKNEVFHLLIKLFIIFEVEDCIGYGQENRNDEIYNMHLIMVNLNLAQDVANKREIKHTELLI